MKKLMFLTMVFGLMMVFSGSVSAQLKGAVVAPCTEKFKPQMNDPLGMAIITAINPNDGRKAYFTIRNGARECNVRLQAPDEQLKKLLEQRGVKSYVEFTGKVTKIEKFADQIRTGDQVTLELVNEKTATARFMRGNAHIGTATFAVVKK